MFLNLSPLNLIANINCKLICHYCFLIVTQYYSFLALALALALWLARTPSRTYARALSLPEQAPRYLTGTHNIALTISADACTNSFTDDAVRVCVCVGEGAWRKTEREKGGKTNSCTPVGMCVRACACVCVCVCVWLWLCLSFNLSLSLSITRALSVSLIVPASVSVCLSPSPPPTPPVSCFLVHISNTH